MRRNKGLSWLIGLSLVAGLSACAPDGNLESVMIFSNVSVSKKTQCIAETGGGATTETRPIGVLDLMVANHYWMYPMIYNGLDTTLNTTEASPKEMSADAHVVTVRGAWVTYEIDGLKGQYDGGETVLPKQWLPTSGSVLPLAYATLKIEAVPPNIALALDRDLAFDPLGSAGYLNVGVTFEVSMGDGSVLHTETFYYPITVCRGCLTSYEAPPVRCCDWQIAPDFFPCFPGQDERYSCLTGCWLIYRDRVDRFAQKMAMMEGYITNLSFVISTLFFPEGFTALISPLPGDALTEDAYNERENPPEEN